MTIKLKKQFNSSNGVENTEIMKMAATCLKRPAKRSTSLVRAAGDLHSRPVGFGVHVKAVWTTFLYQMYRAIASFISDKLYAKLSFVKNHGRLPRNPPVTFNEYLYDLKSSGKLEQFQCYADKLTVREHVARKVGPQFLVPIFATAKALTVEVWDALPEAFVLKTNHGSKWNRIVRNKCEENYGEIATQVNGWIKNNFYYRRRESQYKKINPTIMFEKLLSDDGSNSITDYKFFCFHGKFRFVLAMIKGKNIKNYYYDRNWVALDIARATRPTNLIPRPRNFDKMIEVAEKLAEDFTFVRVDLYSVGNRVYFGELTFVPGGGCDRFRTVEFEECAGRLWAGENVDLSGFHFNPGKS